MRAGVVHAALAVVLVAGGVAVNQYERYGVNARSFVTHGEVGEELAVWPGAATVHGLRSATLLDTELSEGLTTDGLWVAVDVSVVGGDQPGRAPLVTLVDREGRTFEETSRVSGGVGSVYFGRAAPGSPVRGEIVLEVPKSAVGPVTVVVAERSDGNAGGEAHVRAELPRPELGSIEPAEPTLGPVRP